MRQDELCAEMRLAFSRATVAFPRLNMHPVSIAVYHVFSDVFHELKRKHEGNVPWNLDPYDEELNETMTVFVDQARAALLPRGVVEEVTRGMPPVRAKTVGQLVAGLNLPEAKSLFMLASSSKDMKAIKERRLTMLLTHRNLAANNLVRDALKTARRYFLHGADRDEPSSG